MLIYENETHFIMTTNDDHAHLSGVFARKLIDAVLPEEDRREEFYYAVSEHDRAWIDLDEVPIWNDFNHRPFSVIDYPLALRVLYYVSSIEQVVELSPYAGLLHSLHYTSFKPEAFAALIGGINPKIMSIIAAEKKRQNELIQSLGLTAGEPERLLKKHLALLQLLDALSLTICMQEPGTELQQANLTYLQSFGQALDHAVFNAFIPSWLSPSELQLTPSLFKSAFPFTLKRKLVPKQLVRELGITKAYQESTFTEVQIYMQ